MPDFAVFSRQTFERNLLAKLSEHPLKIISVGLAFVDTIESQALHLLFQYEATLKLDRGPLPARPRGGADRGRGDTNERAAHERIQHAR